MDRLRNTTLTWFLARKAAWAVSGCMATESADYCILVNEWAVRVCFLRLEVDMGLVLESELGQEWKYTYAE